MIKRFLPFAIVFCFVLELSSQSKLALVIGNSAYEHGGALKNPENDAKLMKSTLEQLGFEVVYQTDATLVDMQRAFRKFVGSLSSFDVALFFYAGHGMQVDGENYLIPIDAKLEDKASLEFEAFKVATVNRYFKYNQDKLNIMILDACRNNPFRSWMRSGAQGFRSISNQASGTIICFATREGETASDGIGDNGLYTKHLVRQMKKNQGITDVFLNTRIGVMNESDGKQVPQEWNMLTGNFRFTERDIHEGSSPTEASVTSSPNVRSIGTSDENFTAGSSEFEDSRNGIVYPTYGLSATSNGSNYNMTWMLSDVRIEIPGSYEIPGSSNRLYTWTSANMACPEGWHLPTQQELEILIDYFGGASIAGKKMKSESGWQTRSWGETGAGLSFNGFNIKPNGYRNDFGTFSNQGKASYMWSSSSMDAQNAFRISLHYNDDEVDLGEGHKLSAYSCRCIKD